MTREKWFTLPVKVSSHFLERHTDWSEIFEKEFSYREYRCKDLKSSEQFTEKAPSVEVLRQFVSSRNKRCHFQWLRGLFCWVDMRHSSNLPVSNSAFNEHLVNNAWLAQQQEVQKTFLHNIGFRVKVSWHDIQSGAQGVWKTRIRLNSEQPVVANSPWRKVANNGEWWRIVANGGEWWGIMANSGE